MAKVIRLLTGVDVSAELENIVRLYRCIKRTCDEKLIQAFRETLGKGYSMALIRHLDAQNI